MKKALLVAASLFTAATAATTGEAVKASPQFVLTQNSAGNLLFQGVGTAQYNNSIGTNNSFQVGSSTNLGVNASTSSTPEYAVQSHAKLDLATGSTLKQIIGTSGASSQKSAETIAAMEHADTKATETASAAGLVAEGDFTASHGTSYSDWNTRFAQDATYLGMSGKRTFINQADFETQMGGYVSAEETSAYETAYTESYSKAEAAISTSTSTNTSNGVIQGTFTTTEAGEAGATGTIADWQTASSADADSVVYDNFNTDYVTFLANNDKDANGAAKNTYTEDEYNAARSAAWSTAFNESYSESALSSQRTSTSDVLVTGIGSDANVAGASSSTFDVLIDVASGYGTPESTATADGSAGANLSTSSFANQSMASTASAFMQAFGGEDQAIAAAALAAANRVGYTSDSTVASDYTKNSDIVAAVGLLSYSDGEKANIITELGYTPSDFGL